MQQKNKLLIKKDTLVEFLRLTTFTLNKKLLVHFSITDHEILCESGDQSIYMKYTIQHLQPELSGSKFSLSAISLYDFLRKIDLADIELEISETLIKVHHNYGSGCIAQINEVPNYPKLPEEAIGSFQCQNFVFIERLKDIKHIIVPDTGRHHFSGVNFTANNELRVWCTDGYVLAMSALKVRHEGKFNKIAPKRFIDCISSINIDSECHVKLYETHVEYSIKNIKIVSALVNVQPLPIDHLIKNDDKPDLELKLSSTIFAKQVDRIGVLADEAKTFCLRYSEGKCFINSIGINENAIEEVVLVYGKGSDISLYFTISHILSAIKTLKEEIKVVYYANTKVLTIMKADSYPIYVVATRKR